MNITRGRKLSTAIVGLGKMGLLHASLLSVLPNVRLVALCDKSRLLRFFAKRALDIPLVTDNLTKFSNMDLDAVYITTPIPSHYHVVKEVFEKNISCNVFCEKTLSSSRSRSEELSRMASAAGGVTMVGYMKRFSVTFRKIKELLNQKILGDLTSFKAYAYSSDFAGTKLGSSTPSARGGVLEDLGSHILDLALWYFEDLTINSANIESLITPHSVDSAKFEVICSNDLRGIFHVSWIETGYRMPEFGFNIIGKEGSLFVNDNEIRLDLTHFKQQQFFRQDLNDNVPFLLGDSEYYRENENFISCIAKQENPESDFQNGLEVDCLLEQVEHKADA